MAALAVAWSYLAFGAVYPWAAPPLLILSLVALLVARAWPEPRRLTDGAALAALAIVTLQLMPLPPAMLDLVAPDARAFRDAMLLGAPSGGWRPLSLDPALTRMSLALALSAFALFLAARGTAAAHGRAMARWIAWIGIAAACLGIGGRMLFPDGRIYGFWTPSEPGAAPVGAIINRNHFAAWAVIAASLAAGALAASVTRLVSRAGHGRRLAAALSDPRVLWLLFSVALLTAALVFTASRGGFVGLIAAGVAALAMTRRRARGRAWLTIAVLIAVCGAAAWSWSRPDRLLSRIEGGAAHGGRPAIWREAADLTARYPIAGVGLGAFPTAMTHYQRTRAVFYNHAHSQYLELASEGGVLLALPLLLFAAGVFASARRGLAGDAGSFFWLRAGAAAALTGLAVLSIWESAFRTPAVLMLAAVSAGIATSPPRG